MKYILTEEDIKELVYDTSYYRDINVNTLSEEEIIEEFLKFKSPATEIASGKVKNIIYQGSQIIITFNNLPEKLSIGNICGNNMSIYVEEKR